MLKMISEQTNAEDSPLLRLPTEVRNCIYSYALGGNLIHIFRAEVSGLNPRRHNKLPIATHLNHTICRANQTNEHVIQTFDSSGHTPGCDEDRHQDCLPLAHSGRFSSSRSTYNSSVTTAHWRTRLQAETPEPEYGLRYQLDHTHDDYSHLSLCLLRSCRQIYRETALIPYAENSFVFTLLGGPGEDKLVDRFIESLLLGQKRAINTVTLVLDAGFSLNYREMHVAPRNIAALSGLRSLTILLQSNNYEFTTLLANTEARLKVFARLMDFGNLPLTSLRICTYDPLIDFEPPISKQVQSWCAALEHRMLQIDPKAKEKWMVAHGETGIAECATASKAPRRITQRTYNLRRRKQKKAAKHQSLDCY